VYELIVGTRTDKLYLYYELVQVSVIGYVQNMKLIVNVPLKSASSQFTLYKVVALPTRVSKINFVQYSIDYSYFGLENIRHDFILFKETYLLKCVRARLTYAQLTRQCIGQNFKLSVEYIFPDLNLQQHMPQTPTCKSSNSDPSETQDPLFRSNASLLYAAWKTTRG